MTDEVLNALIARAKRDNPSIAEDTIRDLIGALAYDGWREETGRADTVRTPDKILNEACELSTVNLRKLRTLDNEAMREVGDLFSELPETVPDHAAAVLRRVSELMLGTVRECHNYQLVIDRNLREFATRWSQERQADGRPTNVVDPAEDKTKPRVIRFQYNSEDTGYGVYRVVLKVGAVTVEHFTGHDACEGENWTPVTGPLRALLLADVAVMKAYGYELQPPTDGRGHVADLWNTAMLSEY